MGTLVVQSVQAFAQSEAEYRRFSTPEQSAQNIQAPVVFFGASTRVLTDRCEVEADARSWTERRRPTHAGPRCTIAACSPEKGRIQPPACFIRNLTVTNSPFIREYPALLLEK